MEAQHVYESSSINKQEFVFNYLTISEGQERSRKQKEEHKEGVLVLIFLVLG